MKALLLTDASTLRISDEPHPGCGPDEVVLRIAVCGICGSDVHGWDGSSGRRKPPLIMGHEAAGTVAEVGSDVRGWKPGDRATFDSTVYCGRCGPCETGQVNLCRDRRVFGVSPGSYRQHGAFAEYLAVPARLLYRLPGGLSFERAAMVEPLAVALHAVARAGIGSGSEIVVAGSGMIGLLVAQAARHAGARRIIAVDLSEDRLAMARQLGATDTFLSEGEATIAQIRALTGGLGVDAAFEVVGIAPTVDLAMRVCRDSGVVMLVGNLSPNVPFPLQVAVTRELKVLGSCGSAGEYPLAIELLASGAVEVDSLISAVAPLEEGPAWFSRLSGPQGSQTMKVLLRP